MGTMRESSPRRTRQPRRGLLTFSNGYPSLALLRANDPFGGEGERQRGWSSGRR